MIKLKNCEYCNKEISYHQQYCCDDCEKAALNFYQTRERFTKIYSVFNGIFVLCIGIGIFLFSFTQLTGSIMVTTALFALGIMNILLPFPAEIMIHKFKLKKAITLSRYIGYIVLFLGIISLILSIIFVF